MKKNILRGLLLSPVLIACSAIILHACDFCGMYLGITPFDNQSSLSLTHRYRVFNGYASMNQSSGFFPSGAYRVSPAYSTLHSTADSMGMNASDFESYKVIELRGRWFIHPRLELNVLLPFVNNKMKMDDESFKVSGLGDLSVFAAWHILQKTDPNSFRYRLIGGLGVKLPTGRSNAAFDDGDRTSVMLQPGTGSTDGFACLTFTSAVRNWRWGISSLAKYNGENKYGEQVDPSAVNNAFCAYKVQKCNWIFLPQVRVYEEYTKGFRINGALQDGTGMNMVLLGAGIDVYKNRFGFSIAVECPVYQQVDEMGMKTAGRLIAGITYSFNQEKYLLK